MNEMLMIQDDAGVGRGFTRLLGAYHFKAPDWIGGVSSKDLIGGTLQALDVRRQPVQIHLKRYALAFVDGRIIGVADGWELVPILKQAGIVCVGISTMYGDRLREKGAEYVIDPGDFKTFIENDLRGIYDAACASRPSSAA